MVDNPDSQGGNVAKKSDGDNKAKSFVLVTFLAEIGFFVWWYAPVCSPVPVCQEVQIWWPLPVEMCLQCMALNASPRCEQLPTQEFLTWPHAHPTMADMLDSAILRDVRRSHSPHELGVCPPLALDVCRIYDMVVIWNHSLKVRHCPHTLAPACALTQSRNMQPFGKPQNCFFT